jgi:aldose 1-epimerase
MLNSEKLLRLHANSLELAIAPKIGGSIARLDWIGGGKPIPILRGCEDVPAHVLEAGSFPLVPYVNRIRDGRFSFRGRAIRLAPNMTDDPSPLHGQGWLGAWEVVGCSDTRAELRFAHEAGEWPWTYEARQSFLLRPTRLDLVLSCRNLSDEPMPCGLGQHPYFPCDSATKLRTQVSHAWTIDHKVLPVERVEASGRFDLTDRPICARDLDHGFEGWGGKARIAFGNGLSVEMSSDTARFFQVYSPAGGKLFVAEPVTHRNAALNEPEEQWPEAGLKVLEPGEEMALAMRLSVVSPPSG